ncbi:MAG: hypothetical protein ACR2K9_00020 [Solirubrobacteraceae bacterium]
MAPTVIVKRLVVGAAVAGLVPAVLSGCGDSKSQAQGSAAAKPSQSQIDDRTSPKVTFAPAGDKLLPANHLLVKSALGVDTTHQSVTLPLHKGRFGGQTVWFVITEASDFGLSHDLNVNFSSKLANMGIGCDACVQDVTLNNAGGNKFGDAVVNFEGVPNFKPKRSLISGPAAGPAAFPPANAKPGAVAGARYSPFIRVKGSSVVYNAPIVAVGDRKFDVDRHTNTADRVLKMKLPGTPASGGSEPGSVEMLLVHGLEAGKDIFYMSTEASDPVAATLERATFVPALQHAPFVGGDDTLGSARERIFLFTNGETGKDNPNSQGLSHLIKDGVSGEDASLSNTKLLAALRDNDGDALNVLGDFPSLADPRHANAYSPLWDAQVGEWTKKALAQKLDKRQNDENAILNLAHDRPDLLTGPLGAKYGAGDFVINCPTIAFKTTAPDLSTQAPKPGGQF